MGKATRAAMEVTRRRLITAAGRSFRTYGYGGVGVDSVAKAAGVTSGAFYGHFASKAEIFDATLAEGLEEMRAGIAALRETHGATWLPVFATWYMSEQRREQLATSCALATLSTEAARAGRGTRDLYAKAFEQIVAEVAAGLGGAKRKGDAIAILAMLAGGLAIAHAARDADVAARITDSVVAAVQRIGGATT